MAAPSNALPWDVPDDQIVRSTARLGWRGLQAAEILHPDDEFHVPPFERHIAVLNLGKPMEAHEANTGRNGRLGQTGMMFLPAGRDRMWNLHRTGEVRHLHLYVTPAFLEATSESAGLDPATVELRDAYGVRDPLLEQLGRAVLGELRSDGLAGGLFADSLSTFLAVHLLRRYSNARLPIATRGQRLPRETLRIATEYIDEHLSDDLQLSVVAASAHLSPYHFARLFKASTGVTVHRFVTSRRVRRAEQLLVGSDASVTAIAYAVGFSSASHLARHFRALLGVRPNDLRR